MRGGGLFFVFGLAKLEKKQKKTDVPIGTKKNYTRKKLIVP